MYTNEAIAAIQPKDGVDGMFLHYACSDYLLNNANENIYGAKLMNQHLINNATVALPPLIEQQKISAHLDKNTAIIDTLIEKKRQMVELLKEERAAIINQAVTKGIDPKVELIDSGVEWIGEIPKGWSVKRFKFCGRFVGGGTPSTEDRSLWDGEIPWVSAKDMKTSVIDDAKDHINERAVRESATAILPPGSLLMVFRSGILQHSIPISINTRAVAINQDLKGFLPRYGVLPGFLAHIIDGNQENLLSLWRKQGATVESLNLQVVKDSLLPLPSIAEQKEIAAHLDEKTGIIDLSIKHIEKSIDLLTEYRSSLITHVVTGKREVV